MIHSATKENLLLKDKNLKNVLQGLIISKDDRTGTYVVFTDIIGLHYLSLPYMLKCMPLLKSGIFFECEYSPGDDSYHKPFSTTVISQIHSWTYQHADAIALVYCVIKYMIKPQQALPDLWLLLKDLSANFLIVNHEKIYNFVLYVFYYAGAMPHTQFFNNYFYQNSSLPRWYDFNVHYLSSRQKIDILVSCVLHAEVSSKIEVFCISFILKIVDS